MISAESFCRPWSFNLVSNGGEEEFNQVWRRRPLFNEMYSEWPMCNLPGENASVKFSWAALTIAV